MTHGTRQTSRLGESAPGPPAGGPAAAAGYCLAVALAWVAIRPAS